MMHKVEVSAIRAGDKIYIQHPGCGPQCVGVADTSARIVRGYVEFRIKNGMHSWTRRHFPGRKILVDCE